MQFLLITEERSNFFFKWFTEVILDDRVFFLAIFLERMSDQLQSKAEYSWTFTSSTVVYSFSTASM